MRLPGVDDGTEFYFGFGGEVIPDWRDVPREPMPTGMLSELLGFETATIDSKPARKQSARLPVVREPEIVDDEPPVRRWRDRREQPNIVINVPPAQESPALLKVAEGLADAARAFAANAARPPIVNVTLPKQPKVKGIKRNANGDMIAPVYEED